MPPWPLHFFSDSAEQIPNDIDFARSFRHPASGVAPPLSDSPPPGHCLFFRCSPGPTNSAPGLSAGLSAAPTARQSPLPVLAPRSALKLLFSHTIRLSRADRSCRNNNRIAAATFPDCLDLSPEGRSLLRASLARSVPVSKTSRPRRGTGSRKVNPDRPAQTASGTPHAFLRLGPGGRRCRPPVECKRCHPCCSPAFWLFDHPKLAAACPQERGLVCNASGSLEFSRRIRPRVPNLPFPQRRGSCSWRFENYPDLKRRVCPRIQAPCRNSSARCSSPHKDHPPEWDCRLRCLVPPRICREAPAFARGRSPR